jgi:hypothetical protein
VLTRRVWVAAFSTSLSATRVRPGQTLRVTFRAIEALVSRPVVTFKQPGRAAVSVPATLTDGSWRASFRVRAGDAGTGRVRIAARDSGGRDNRVSLAVRVAS